MNIAIFDAAPYWSGGAQRVYFYCRELKRVGVNVILFCLPTSRLNYLLKGVVKIYNIFPLSDLGLISLLKICFIVCREKVDILDLHSPKFYWLGLFAGRVLGKKVVITRNVIYRKKGVKKFINKFLYDGCDAVICVSEKVKQILVEDFNIPQEKIEVIYDAIEVKDFSPEEIRQIREKVRKEYNVEKKTFLLLTIGRVEKIKGYDVIVKAVKKLVDRGLNVKFISVGKTEDKCFYSEIEKFILNNKIEGYIQFVGFKDEVEHLIIASDVIVSGSYYESLGKSIVEGLFYNKPFVATSVGGLREVVSDKHGVFVEKIDPDSLAEAIVKVKDNYNLYMNNMKYFNKKVFSIDEMVRKYLKVLDRIK